jgi:signal transduction histidine kinase
MQLLSLSRIELGNLRPELCEIDLKSKVEQAVAKIRLLAEAKGVVIDMSGLKSTAWGDFDMMDQVLTNYLTNAIEHTPPGGKVRIFEEDRGERVRVSVFNEGEPIPEEELPKIWEKFYKIDKARTRTGGGTGIGLSIVKVIMEAHGNACGVINRENGVEFYFEMDQHASPG